MKETLASLAKILIAFAGVLLLVAWMVFPRPDDDFPFAFTGGRGQATVFTVLTSGETVPHEGCVLPAWGDGFESEGVLYWISPLDVGSVFFDQVREQPLVFYEFDRGSGVASYCAEPMDDQALAARVMTKMRELCGDLPSSTDPSRLAALRAFGGDRSPCQEPPALRQRRESRR